MRDLVEIIAKALVENPDEVVVSETKEGKDIIIELHVAPSDMGKVMGAATKALAGLADGRTISTIVRKLLA